jgi:crotonobetainyl-CoA:carnitine CoA-transferase CaiB-like acyl-CoA transferase
MLNPIPATPWPFEQQEARGGPLGNIRVLDLSAYIAGPYGCSLLADMGAQVIKIEPPAGDNLRKYPSTLEGESRAFLGVNRSKIGVVLDLKQPEDKAAFLQLVQAADVLVHNFRPGVPPRLGISYEEMKILNPRLIYCAVTGYGDSGPLCNNAGYDQVLQSRTGMCSMQGKKDGPPEILYGSMVDYYAASMLSTGISAALYEREQSGQGQYVAVSLLSSALAMQSARLIWAEGEPRERGRDMRSGGVTGIHPTRDGYLYLSANTPHFWQALCEKTGQADLLQNPRYDSVKKRAEHAEELVPRLHQALQAHSALEWERLFGQDVPCAAARTIEDMFDDPQVQAEGLITSYEHPLVGTYRGFTGPIKFGRTPGPRPFAAPAFGQHNRQLFADGNLLPA